MAVQFFPESVRKLWNKWQLRVMILISLSLQIILVIFGSRRKHTAKAWLRILVWSTYLSADWVATVCLGTLASGQGDSPKDAELMAFWAPFFLLHLGGPDTITAYSLEDNELWLRHLLGLLVQVGVAFYVFLRSWASSLLTFLTIPMFFSGIIKYGERTWVLRSASSEHFRDSLLPSPDPGPDYAALMEELSSRQAQGLPVNIAGVIEPPYIRPPHPFSSNAGLLEEAYFLFGIFKRLYADLILSFQDKGDSSMSITSGSPLDAFKLVEFELGFMFDVLYTKATIVYSRLGAVLRCSSFLSSIFTSLAFWIFIEKHPYSKINICITYALLVGSVFLEGYAIVALLFSDWTKLWLTEHKKAPPANLIYRAIFSSQFVWTNKRWSGLMAQFNLIDFCLKNKLPCSGVRRCLGISEMLEHYHNMTWENVTDELKQLIFELLNSHRENFDSWKFDSWHQWHEEGSNHVTQMNDFLDKFGWSLAGAEFDESLLLWHIATDLCYYSDFHGHQDGSSLSPRCKLSKSLSDYMMYLLVMRPFMLPKGIGEIRFRDTCAEAIRFFQQRKRLMSSSRSNARKSLLQVSTEHFEPCSMKGDRSKSALFDGCRLAKLLESLIMEDGFHNETKWEMISQVWVKMLSFAAIQCEWKHHGQQLRRGEELLSHVGLLMAHLGLYILCGLLKVFCYVIIILLLK
ncbi:uncharacterized protein LOC131164215 [Malania oleifera]|uniref:uncharacterized protein LOC131164215 n=1 Tax=Malania oleifera TaxID=397392 RepID=UPI0025AE3ECC|nr:uncharacterized protein LOC131164215 [Malania oleifera]